MWDELKITQAAKWARLSSSSQKFSLSRFDTGCSFLELSLQLFVPTPAPLPFCPAYKAGSRKYLAADRLRYAFGSLAPSTSMQLQVRPCPCCAGRSPTQFHSIRSSFFLLRTSRARRSHSLSTLLSCSSRQTTPRSY